MTDTVYIKLNVTPVCPQQSQPAPKGNLNKKHSILPLHDKPRDQTLHFYISFQTQLVFRCLTEAHMTEQPLLSSQTYNKHILQDGLSRDGGQFIDRVNNCRRTRQWPGSMDCDFGAARGCDDRGEASGTSRLMITGL